jgi:hypothetical protein
VARDLLDFLPFAKHLRAWRKKSWAGASSAAPARDPMAGRRCTAVEAEGAAAEMVPLEFGLLGCVPWIDLSRKPVGLREYNKINLVWFSRFSENWSV